MTRRDPDSPEHATGLWVAVIALILIAAWANGCTSIWEARATTLVGPR